MKVADLKEVAKLEQEPSVIEIKPGARYLLHIKRALPMHVQNTIQEQFANFAPDAKIAVYSDTADIALYEIKAVE